MWRSTSHSIAGELLWAGEHLRIDLPGASALFTTRRGGTSTGPYAALDLSLREGEDVARNRELAGEAIGIAPAAWAQGRQVHGTRVVVNGPTLEEADGQVVTGGGRAAIVLVADCLPVALLGGDGAVGMVHAGWRGLACGVIAEGVGAVRAAAGAGDGPLVGVIGPGIGPCCYAVGDEVRAAFGTTEATLDLKAIARGQLAAAGVDDVLDSGLCTACDPERFFSHRRDRGVTGRQAGYAWST
jgi:polyphenol oxidase